MNERKQNEVTMPPNLETVAAEIPAFEQRVKKWQATFMRHMAKQHGGRSLQRLSWADRRRLAEKQVQLATERAGLAELEQIYAFYDRLCAAYLTGSVEECEKLRKAVLELAWLGTGPYSRSRGDKMTSAQDATEMLRLALAGISLGDYSYYPGSTQWRQDYVDLEIILDILAEKAAALNLDIVPHLEETATISSPKPSRVSPESPSVQAMMRNYAARLRKK